MGLLFDANDLEQRAGNIIAKLQDTGHDLSDHAVEDLRGLIQAELKDFVDSVETPLLRELAGFREIGNAAVAEIKQLRETVDKIVENGIKFESSLKVNTTPEKEPQ